MAQSGTDVSDLRDPLSREEPDVCDPEDHVIVNPPGDRKRQCDVCGYSTQTLTTWFDQDLRFMYVKDGDVDYNPGDTDE